MMPRYQRAEIPPAMRFQERDGAILQTIYEHDGVLAKRQLKAMFWPQASQRAMEMRLSLLYHQGYLDWPSREHWRSKPICESVCWLGWKGILWIAGRHGLAIESPKTTNEAQLRRLDKRLHDLGVRWVREPRWSQLQHDLAIVDFRQAVENAVKELPTFHLESWISEGEFLSRPDEVTYAENGSQRQRKRKIRPDSHFTICDERRRSQGLPARARFLVEVDMATHDVGSFGNEKILAGLAYLHSPAYKARFEDNAGRWLVITSGQTRLNHLARQAQKLLGPSANAFLFTTLAQANSANVLTSRIWAGANESEPMALLSQPK